MKRIFILPAAIALAANSYAQIVLYSFTGSVGSEVSLNADSQPSNGTASAMTRGSGVTASAAADTFSASGWSTSGFDANDYFEFTLTPSTGFSLSLTSLEVDERRSGTGIRNWSVRSSLDSFASDISSFSVPDDTATRANQTITLGGATYTDLASAITFRIYGFASEAAAGTWRIDNVEAFGSFTAVPEPSEYAALTGAGLVGFALWRRRVARKA